MFLNFETTADDYALEIVRSIDGLPLAEKVEALNRVRKILHEASPFKDEPIDFVTWVKADCVKANDYNPNKVAPPEMQLLEISIMNDGYTQPIVTWPQENHVEVVDGFHRSRVGKESKVVSERVKGFLPTVAIRKEQSGKNDRVASTIRHNRARGKHQVDAMSEIVIELKNRNWTNSRIARELGMDEDEVLRLCQISGLGELFSDQDFSRAWEASDSVGEFEELTDVLDESETASFRTINTDDPNRVFHTYDKWECHKAGLYASCKDGWTSDECLQQYKVVLSNAELFDSILAKIVVEWKHSCEHYLTNVAMNRIAWLGQAAVCYHSGVPSKFSAGWNLLNTDEQAKANEVALMHLNAWLEANGRQSVDMHDALSVGRQVNIY
jgi:ParB-like chromosome segregation protein Spo0J